MYNKTPLTCNRKSATKVFLWDIFHCKYPFTEVGILEKYHRPSKIITY